MGSAWSAGAHEVFHKAGGHRGQAYGNRTPRGPADHPRFSAARQRRLLLLARHSAALSPSSTGRGSARYRRPPGLLLPFPESSLYAFPFAIVLAAASARFFNEIEFRNF